MSLAPVPVPLTPIVREIVLGSPKSLTHGELMNRLLSVGINLQPGELSAALSKLLDKNEVRRERVGRVSGRGRRLVWAYSKRGE